MLAELVRPEYPVGLILADPELVHVGEQVHLAIGLEEGVNWRTSVRWNGGSIGFAIRGVRLRVGIVLSANRRYSFSKSCTGSHRKRVVGCD